MKNKNEFIFFSSKLNFKCILSSSSASYCLPLNIIFVVSDRIERKLIKLFLTYLSFVIIVSLWRIDLQHHRKFPIFDSDSHCIHFCFDSTRWKCFLNPQELWIYIQNWYTYCIKFAEFLFWFFSFYHFFLLFFNLFSRKLALNMKIYIYVVCIWITCQNSHKFTLTRNYVLNFIHSTP